MLCKYWLTEVSTDTYLSLRLGNKPYFRRVPTCNLYKFVTELSKKFLLRKHTLAWIQYPSLFLITDKCLQLFCKHVIVISQMDMQSTLWHMLLKSNAIYKDNCFLQPNHIKSLCLHRVYIYTFTCLCGSNHKLSTLNCQSPEPLPTIMSNSWRFKEMIVD